MRLTNINLGDGTFGDVTTNRTEREVKSPNSNKKNLVNKHTEPTLWNSQTRWQTKNRNKKVAQVSWNKAMHWRQQSKLTCPITNSEIAQHEVHLIDTSRNKPRNRDMDSEWKTIKRQGQWDDDEGDSLQPSSSEPSEQSALKSQTQESGTHSPARPLHANCSSVQFFSAANQNQISKTIHHQVSDGVASHIHHIVQLSRFFIGCLASSNIRRIFRIIVNRFPDALLRNFGFLSVCGCVCACGWVGGCVVSCKTTVSFLVRTVAFYGILPQRGEKRLNPVGPRF